METEKEQNQYVKNKHFAVELNKKYSNVHCSTSEDSLANDLVAISIEDTDNTNAKPPDEEPKTKILLPIRTAAMCESNSYEWKEITQEFFEAVQGLALR